MSLPRVDPAADEDASALFSKFRMVCDADLVKTSPEHFLVPIGIFHFLEEYTDMMVTPVRSTL